MGKILLISKWIAGIIGAIMAIIGVVSLIYSQGVKSEALRSTDSAFEKTTITTLSSLVSSDSIRSEKLDIVNKKIR